MNTHTTLTGSTDSAAGPARRVGRQEPITLYKLALEALRAFVARMLALRPSRVLMGLFVALTASLGIVAVAAPANAYANQWVYYNTDADRYYDMAVWYGADGRIGPDVWFDYNNDNRWDSTARDTNRDGQMDELWVDSASPGGGWDYLVTGNMLYTGQNQWSYNGVQVSGGPYGTSWATAGFTSTTITGRPPSSATAGGAFYNLMIGLARQTGTVAW